MVLFYERIFTKWKRLSLQLPRDDFAFLRIQCSVLKECYFNGVRTSRRMAYFECRKKRN